MVMLTYHSQCYIAPFVCKRSRDVEVMGRCNCSTTDPGSLVTADGKFVPKPDIAGIGVGGPSCFVDVAGDLTA